ARQGDRGGRDRRGLRSLLHQEAARRRHGTRPLRRLWHRAGTRRLDRRRERARPGELLPDLAALRGRVMAAQILVIDDDAEMAAVLCERLTRRGFGVAVETCSAHALDRIGGEDFRAGPPDVRIPRVGGTELCERIRASRPGLPVLVITAFGDLEIAVLAIRAGAYDFLTKPIEIEELAFRLDRACEHRRLTQEVVRLREREMPPAGDLLGESAEMERLREIAARVAPSDGQVVVLGETGSGKERVARAIHRQSARGAGPFVAVNCAAMPEHLIESELFGHERGAFTDARSARVGMLAQANRGTLLLDEIGELPLPLQPKLLRALQE